MSTVGGAGAERIAAAFATERRAALMPYMMSGFPDQERSAAVGAAYADGGADLIELGVPYSDPLADGPVIQAAGTQALRAGSTVDRVFTLCEELAARLPVVLMVCANVIYARGVGAFCAAARDAGASGLIVPDLPLEESPAVLEAADTAGVALVPLVAPTTPEERMARIGAQARGFLYTVSVVGTTGERQAPEDAWAPILARASAHTEVPVALGFGISTPEQARRAAEAGADGVIVGTRLVREAAEHSGRPAAAVRELVAGLAAALDL